MMTVLNEINVNSITPSPPSVCNRPIPLQLHNEAATRTKEFQPLPLSWTHQSTRNLQPMKVKSLRLRWLKKSPLYVFTILYQRIQSSMNSGSIHGILHGILLVLCDPLESSSLCWTPALLSATVPHPRSRCDDVQPQFIRLFTIY